MWRTKETSTLVLPVDRVLVFHCNFVHQRGCVKLRQRDYFNKITFNSSFVAKFAVIYNPVTVTNKPVHFHRYKPAKNIQTEDL